MKILSTLKELPEDNPVPKMDDSSNFQGSINPSENVLEAIVESSPDPIWVKDVEGKHIYINKAFEQFHNLKRSEVLGRFDSELFDEEKVEFYQSIDQRILQTKQPETVFDLVEKDDKTLYMMTIKIPYYVKDKEIKGIMGFARNITIQEEAKQLLENQNALLSRIFKYAPDPIFVKNVDSVYIRMNQAFADFHHKTIEELLGKTDFDLFNEKSAIQFIKEDKRVMNTGKTVKSESSVIINNQKRISISTKSPLKNADGMIIGVVGIGHELTYTRQIESQLIEAQKMESIANLAGGIAHDLNNILASVLGHASMLIEEERDEAKQSSLSNIINSAERAAQLIKRLRMFTKKDKGQIKRIDLNEIVKEVYELVNPSLNKLIQIHLDLDKSISTIDGDSTQLAQVFMNLLLNSVEAISHQGTIEVITDACKLSNFDHFVIKPKNAKIGNYIRITVRDDGVGINNENIQKIFEPFYTTKTDGEVKGTGLGMSIVYTIVKHHEGLLDIKSRINGGTTIQIYFPKGKIKKPTPHKDKESMDRGSGFVLIVDDDASIRKLLSMILEKLGYYYLIAVDGVDALNKFKQNHTDLDCVILDMIMPKMDGIETYKKMKDIDPNVKVILSSGYDKSSGSQELLDLGVTDFLEKPYGMKDIADKVRAVINLQK